MQKLGTFVGRCGLVFGLAGCLALCFAPATAVVGIYAAATARPATALWYALALLGVALFLAAGGLILSWIGARLGGSARRFVLRDGPARSGASPWWAYAVAIVLVVIVSIGAYESSFNG